jgi:ATP synthase protein I
MGKSRDFRLLRRAAFRLAGWQGAITAVAALAAGVTGGPAGAGSALLGGGIGLVAGLYQALRMFRSSAADDPAGFYRGVWMSEVVKILLTGALFILAIRVLGARFAPMMVAYAGTFIAYWVALGTGFPWLPPVQPAEMPPGGTAEEWERALGGPPDNESDGR